MEGLKRALAVAALAWGMMGGGPAWAQMGGHGGEGKGGHEMAGRSMEHGGGGKDGMMTRHGGGGHLFGPHWRKTLTDEQKTKADQMHLKLGKDMSTIEAQEQTKIMELNHLVTQDKTDQEAINRKIGEITALKAKMMEMRYAHIAEMRRQLTPEQRVSFDMGFFPMRHGGGHAQ